MNNLQFTFKKILHLTTYILHCQEGQALVTLLFFMLIGISVTSAAIAVLLTNALGTGSAEQGMTAYYVAESGMEDAILKMDRNSNYSTPGYTLSVDGGSAFVQVSGGIATSTGTLSNAVRKIQVQTVYNNNILIISSWKEIK